MRKFKDLLIVLAFFGLTACSGGNGPEAIAEKFNVAVYSADFEGAKELCTEDSKQAIDFIAAFASQSVDEMKKTDVKFSMTEVTIAEDGNSAVVKGVVLGSYDLQKNEVKDSLDTKTDLVKVDDKWLVKYKIK